MSKGLRSIADEQNLSIKDISEKSGLSSWTIHSALKGLMSPKTRQRLAEALNVSPSYLGATKLRDRKGGRRSRGDTYTPQSSSIKSGQQQTGGSLLGKSEKDVLLNAFFLGRKENGYSREEASSLFTWAEDIRKNNATLERLLSGKAKIDFSEDGENIAVVDINQD